MRTSKMRGRGRLIFVRELRPKVVALVHDLTRRADHFAAIAIDPAADRERVAAERAQLTKDFVAVEAMQQSSFFESADARLRYNARRELRDAAMELCAVVGGGRVAPCWSGAASCDHKYTGIDLQCE